MLSDGMAQDGIEPFGRDAARIGKIGFLVPAVKFQILLFDKFPGHLQGLGGAVERADLRGEFVAARLAADGAKDSMKVIFRKV